MHYCFITIVFFITLQCSLQLTPPLDSYHWQNDEHHLGIPGEKQVLNVSLALQLARTWRRLHSDEGNTISKVEKQKLQLSYFIGS